MTTQLNSPQELSFILKLQQRDNLAFNKLVLDYSSSIRRIVAKYFKGIDDQNDLLQDYWLRIWQKIKLFDYKKSRLYAWLVAIARNLCLDKIRRYKNYSFYDLESQRQNVDSSYSTQFEVDHIGVFDLFEVLNSKEQKVMNLVFKKDYTQCDAAKELSIPTGTSKSRVRKSLMKLRKAI